MKKILLVAIAIISVNFSFAQGVKFEKGSFDEAMDKAKALNKAVFIYFTKDN